MSSLLPLGFFGGNPSDTNASDNAYFEWSYDQFTALMGARPVSMNAYVDYTLDPSLWAANAQFTASSWAATGASYVGPTSGTIPVIGIPMSSPSGSWGNVDQSYQAIISGQYDADYTGVVDAWANNGFKTIDLRIGYEFNGNFQPWAPGNSGSPTATADFVAAWQHIANLVHAEGAADGITVSTVWNPDDIQWTSQPATAYYPGNQYVDIIGTDTYNQIYNGNLTNWTSWNRATTDYSQSPDEAAWLANPENVEQYWTYSNSNQWQPTGQGAGWSIQQAVELAEETGKPLGIAETGASGSIVGDAAGDSVFPGWLAAELTQAGGPQIAFVNIWATDQSDGHWGFLDGEQPAEAAAWAAAFGVSTGSGTTGPGVAEAAGPVTVAAAPLSLNPLDVAQFIGAGPDQLTLLISEDAYQGDAAFTVSVDGVQVGGTETAVALHGSAQDQSFVLAGNWGPGRHVVTVDFLNDAWGGTASTDRNLYVDGATYDGVRSSTALSLYNAGSQSVLVGVAGSASVSFSDDRGVTEATPVLLTGSADIYAGTLDGNLHQWIGGGAVDWFSTDSFASLVTAIDLTDGAGGSYGVSNFEEANVALSGATNGTLTVDNAAGGTIRLGSGNYTATVAAQAASGDTAARNTFTVGFGSGAETLTLDASKGFGHTSVDLTLGTGLDTVSVIWPGHVNVTGGSGTGIVDIMGGTNTVHAAGGSLEVNATSGATAYQFGVGDGTLTIDHFDTARDSLTLDVRQQAGLAQMSDGHGGVLLYVSVPTVGVDIRNMTSFDTSTIQWVQGI